jgi:hypothetical protein
MGSHAAHSERVAINRGNCELLIWTSSGCLVVDALCERALVSGGVSAWKASTS